MKYGNTVNDCCEVLLINPPSSKGKVKRGEFFTPPMGLAYIASVLLEEGISVKIIDCDPGDIFIDPMKPSKMQVENFFLKLKELESVPLIIGIGPCTTPNLLNNITIAKYSKLFFDKSFVILGGPHPSLIPPTMANRILQEYSFIDIIVIGEGEITVREIFQTLKNGQSLNSIPGIVYRNNGTPSNYVPRSFVEDLDTLPFPARFLLKNYLAKYKMALRRNLLMTKRIERKIQTRKDEIPFTVIFSSRGCPYRCVFCCSSKNRRLRTPENIMSEIENCVEFYGVQFFIFYDDLFTTASEKEKDRVLKICNLMKEKALKVYWQVELRINVICKLGESILRKMNDAGCLAVNIGIEKGTQNGLDFLKKDIQSRDIREAINLLRKSGDFIINGTFILGGNGETQNDLKKIITFSEEIGLDYVAFYPLEIHPGTELFEIARTKGIIKDYWEPYQSSKDYPLFVTKELSKRDLLFYKRLGFRSFYFRFRYICKRLKNLSSPHHFLIFIQEYLHLFYHAFLEHTWFEYVIPNKLKEVIFSAG